MQLRIRVGAALDANVAGLFRPLEAQAKKARATIEAELNAGGRRGVEAVRAEFAKAAKEFDQAGAAAKRAGRTVDDSLSGAAKRAADGARVLGDAYEREAKRAGNAMERHVLRIGRGAMQTMGATYNRAQAVARDVARGAGVDLDVGSIVSRRVELQPRAIDLTNAGYMPLSTLAPGQKRSENNVRQNPGDLIKQAQEIGNLAAYDPTKVLECLQAYVGKTGDLETGRDLLPDMAVLARARPRSSLASST